MESGWLRVSSTCVGEVAFADFRLPMKPVTMPGGWYLMIALSSHATSAAVSGTPSDHFMPVRMLKYPCVGEVYPQLVATAGTLDPLASIDISAGYIRSLIQKSVVLSPISGL